MAKTVMPIIPIFILSSCIIVVSSLSYPVAKAEEVRAGVSVSPKAGLPEGGPPSLSRNPFISAPYGRMDKRPINSETQPDINTIGKSGESSGSLKKADKIEEANKEDIIKELRVKGVLLSGNDPMALVGDRIVKIGDKIGAHIITDINRKGILLSYGDKIILIPLE